MTDPPTPMIAATSAVLVRSSPEASEKLTAARVGTPSASSTPEVAPTLAIAPPAVIGRIDAAAARQRMTSANVGEKPTPSAQSRKRAAECPHQPAAQQKAARGEGRSRARRASADAVTDPS